MTGKIQKVSREFNGVSIEQRSTDGFINGTAMCVACGKEIKDWLVNKETMELFIALATDLGVDFNPGNSPDSYSAGISAPKYNSIFPELIISRRGSPESGGGTWIHPDLATPLAQWCSPAFAIQVSRWVQDWAVTGRNPVANQADLDRVTYRSNLKDEARLRMTDQVKEYLLRIQKYDDSKYSGIYFARVHDALNVMVTGETAKQMRFRLGEILGRELRETELIRDYFPAMYLQRYISLCEAAANFMDMDNLKPLDAVDRAAQYSLHKGYQSEPIDFQEHIRITQGRVISLLAGSDQMELPSSNRNF
jgi:hypothetical protein